MSDFFYRNPRLLVLTVCLIVVSGGTSLVLLPRMEDPVLAERIAIVNTAFPGASAERVEALVTDPIESELREIEEVLVLQSVSRFGISTITIELADEVTEVDEVWSRIRDRLADAERAFPADAAEPRFRRLDMRAYAKIFAFVWQQDDAPNYAILRRHAETFKNVLLGVNGTERVRLFGDPTEEITVTVDSDRLQDFGISAADVARSIERSDAKRPAGAQRGGTSDRLIELDSEITTVRRIDRTPVIITPRGHVVTVGDLGEVEKGIAEPASSLAIVGGRPAVALGVLAENNRRIDKWSRDIERRVAEYRGDLAPGLSLEPVFDQSQYVERRLNVLVGNLLLGAAGVMVVILLLMGWQSAIVVGIALPLSALIVLTGLRFLEIPIHQMSITGLIIALGLLIDNAIVMVDEVGMAMRKGAAPQQAVSRTVRHLALPLLGSTVTTALAFAPIALMNGPAGEFVGSIAISVILSIFASLGLSLTVVPTLAAWGVHYGGRREVSQIQGIRVPQLTHFFTKALRAVLKRPILGVAVGMVIPCFGFIACTTLPEQFFPPADRDQFHIEVELPSDASLATTRRITSEVTKTVLRDERVVGVDWFHGESAPSFYYNVIQRREATANYAQAKVQLRSAEGSVETIRDLQETLDQQFPSIRLLVRQLEQGPPFDAPVEVRIVGPDLQQLRQLGDDVRSRLAEIPNVIHTQSDLSLVVPKWSVSIDEESMLVAGVDHSMVASQLSSTLDGTTGGTILEATEELPIRVRVSSAERGDIDAISSLEVLPNARLSPSRRQAIPLSAIGTIDLKPESAAVTRRNSERTNEIKAYLKAGILPATVVAAFRDTLAESPLKLPPGYRIELGGEAAERDDAVGSLFASVGVLMVLMAATLVICFGSFRIAAMVGAVAALSLGLGFAALWLFGHPFGFMAIIGSMGLMGVAINDAIVVLAGIRADKMAKGGDLAAIERVVLEISRHVIATTLTTIVGFAPLVLGGGGFWPPMAVAIAGGVAGATILALLFVPASYVLLICRDGSVTHKVSTFVRATLNGQDAPANDPQAA